MIIDYRHTTMCLRDVILGQLLLGLKESFSLLGSLTRPGQLVIWLVIWQCPISHPSTHVQIWSVPWWCFLPHTSRQPFVTHIRPNMATMHLTDRVHFYRRQGPFFSIISYRYVATFNIENECSVNSSYTLCFTFTVINQQAHHLKLKPNPVMHVIT